MLALLLSSGEAVHDNVSKASALDNLFASHSTVDDWHRALSAAQFITEGRLTSIRLSENEVQYILIILKPSKAPGPDRISTHVLELISPTISKPLTLIFLNFIPPTRNFSRYVRTGKCHLTIHNGR